jgi:hypothetical protein
MAMSSSIHAPSDEQLKVEPQQPELVAEVQRVQAQRDQGFDKICAYLARKSGYTDNTDALSDELREQMAKEAEELIDNWEETEGMKVDWDAEPPQSELHRLIWDYHSLSEYLLHLRDVYWERAGILPSSEEEHRG